MSKDDKAREGMAKASKEIRKIDEKTEDLEAEVNRVQELVELMEHLNEIEEKISKNNGFWNWFF